MEISDLQKVKISAEVSKVDRKVEIELNIKNNNTFAILYFQRLLTDWTFDLSRGALSSSYTDFSFS